MIGKTLLRRGCAFVVVGISFGLLAACATPSTSTGHSVTAKKRSKEYFSESKYGVKASPRVTNKRSRLPRGGGREQVGKPYQVHGKWYYPKQEPGYVKVGMASWYGDAFHGRLTANGEIYDMTHLTGAHPTMPLPSYARVTNVSNGSSVIVRVNDRGPYERGRVVDLSHKAADMLGYAQDGTAKVKVEYVGPAPLDGQDDSYLMASYSPGEGMANPGAGLPTGVMMAMNGASPSEETEQRSATGSSSSEDAMLASAAAEGLPGVALPESGPAVVKRQNGEIVLASMYYGAPPAKGAAQAFERVVGGNSGQGWKQGMASAGDYVMVGSFSDKRDALRLRAKLKAYGSTELQMTADAAGKKWYSLTLSGTGTYATDEMLRAAWAAGATDAMTVRD